MTDASPDRCAFPGCPEPPWSGSPQRRCMYHAPQNAADVAACRQVWEEARRRVARGECNFAGWHFPDCPDNRGFESCRFVNADFRAASFFFGNFTQASFEGPADFDQAVFQETTFFTEVVFAGPASFRGARFSGLGSFDSARFGATASFDDAAFEGTANFHAVRFEQDASFTRAVTDGLGNFDRAVFDSAFFGQSRLKYATFRGASFEGQAYFRQAALGSADFRQAVFADSEFSGITVQEELMFSPPSLPLPLRAGSPFRQPHQGEPAYRLAKQAAQDRGDYRAAGEYHYAEQCAIECGRRQASEIRPWRQTFWRRETCKLWCLLEFFFARCLFGYGERPGRVLLAALLVIVVWAGLYTALDGIGPGELCGKEFLNYRPDYRDALHFSTVTFTTLGYGDLKPKPICRTLADVEALLGASLIALFVVALTRKYMR